MCFAFFFFYAGALSIVQTFAPQAARELQALGAPLLNKPVKPGKLRAVLSQLLMET